MTDGSSEFNKIAENSYRLQKAFQVRKVEFANQLIFRLITVEDKNNVQNFHSIFRMVWSGLLVELMIRGK